MSFKTFKPGKTDYLNQPAFFGDDVSTARYDIQTYPLFETLISKQLAFFWRPEEVDISTDASDFNKMTDAEKHIFTSNLKYQTLLDSIQGRSPLLAFLPLCSVPEAETWIETWSFSETIHSRSYTHIIRNLVNDPETILGDITVNPTIAKRANTFTKYYDNLIEMNGAVLAGNTEALYCMTREEFDREHKKAFLLCMTAVNALEAISFYVSFACSFAFAERKQMEGNAKIIQLISRDESLHLVGTQYMLNQMRTGAAGQEFADLWVECKDEIAGIFIEAANQEKEWAEYLFKDGSIIGLNKAILSEYVEYITNVRMSAVALDIPYPQSMTEPLPWMKQWIISDAVQTAAQEAEISTYETASLDVTEVDLGGLDI